MPDAGIRPAVAVVIGGHRFVSRCTQWKLQQRPVRTAQNVPIVVRRPENCYIGYAITVIVALYRNISVNAPLLRHEVIRGRIRPVPSTAGRPENSLLAAFVARVVARNRGVASRAKLN